jgi:hypothetical protein
MADQGAGDGLRWERGDQVAYEDLPLPLVSVSAPDDQRGGARRAGDDRDRHRNRAVCVGVIGVGHDEVADRTPRPGQVDRGPYAAQRAAVPASRRTTVMSTLRRDGVWFAREHLLNERFKKLER